MRNCELGKWKLAFLAQLPLKTTIRAVLISGTEWFSFMFPESVSRLSTTA